MTKFDELRASHIGQRFGSLVITAYVSRTDGYLCLCDCGHSQKIRFYRVKTMTKCEKCPRTNKGRPVSNDPFVPHRTVYHRYKLSALRREKEWNLSEQEVFDLIVQDCSYCGLVPSTDMKLSAHPDFRYTGIDRVDNDRGYEKDNVVPCCETCNAAKRTMSVDELLTWVARVYNKSVKRTDFSTGDWT